MQLKLNQTILLDGGDVAKSYGVPGLPVVIWIDREGRVADVDTRFHGPSELHKKAKSLLAGR